MSHVFPLSYPGSVRAWTATDQGFGFRDSGFGIRIRDSCFGFEIRVLDSGVGLTVTAAAPPSFQSFGYVSILPYIYIYLHFLLLYIYIYDTLYIYTHIYLYILKEFGATGEGGLDGAALDKLALHVLRHHRVRRLACNVCVVVCVRESKCVDVCV